MEEKKAKYVTVSLPVAISEAMDSLMDELGYWPSRGAFVREACLEKIRKERLWLRAFREAKEETRSERGEEPRRGTNPGISPRETARAEARSTKAPQKEKEEVK